MNNATTETKDARDFDPYHHWLGIPPGAQPPDHYRLLGLERFESDSSVIANAADRQMSHLHHYESGEYAEHVENILSELAVARICLLDPDKKSVYDQQLPGAPDTASARQQGKPTAQFDPYHQWLGIPFEQQTADHYRLLGLERFESDPSVIENSADRHLAYLNSHQAGEHAQHCRKVFGELKAAQACLLDPKRKSAYDKQLKQQLSTSARKSTPPASPRRKPNHATPPTTPPSVVAAGDLSQPADLPSNVPMGPADLTQFDLANFNQPLGPSSSGQLLSAPSFASSVPSKKRSNPILRPFLTVDNWLKQMAGPSNRGMHIAFRACAIALSSMLLLFIVLLAVQSLTPSTEVADNDATTLPNGNEIITEKNEISTENQPGVEPGRSEKQPNELTYQTRQVDDAFTNSIGMKLVLIPAGEFMMGSEESPEQLARQFAGEGESVDTFRRAQPRHRARITKPFYIGTYEVTVGQFRRFVEDQGYVTEAEKDGKGGFVLDTTKNPWRTDHKPEYTWKNPDFAPTDEHPVVHVTWNDAVAFCEWLSRKEGQVYRLPTEAEWEYACRAGTTTSYYCGDDPEKLAGVGNVADGTLKATFRRWPTISARDGYVGTAPVGRFQANAFGVCDMHGNVSEWCRDWYDYYTSSRTDDPPGASTGSLRVCRGGSWSYAAAACRVTYRGRAGPSERGYNIGFRVAMTAADATHAAKLTVDKSSTSQMPALPDVTSKPSLLFAPFDTQSAQQGQQQWADYLKTEITVTNSIGIKLVLIPPGEFMMGSPDSETNAEEFEKPQHRVRITKSFSLQTTEVTQGQWEAVMGTTPWKGQDTVREGSEYPATLVSWNDATEFCRRLSAKDGREYRLPTEAEWEYACRAGSTTRFSFGDSSSELQDYAWLDDNISKLGERYAHRVSRKRPNAWGLYDMHGNVWEWCADWYEAGYYGKSAESDPQGPGTASSRVLRGGAWYYEARKCRSSFRGGDNTPDYGSSTVGFRVAMAVSTTAEATAPAPGTSEATLTNSIDMKLQLIPAGEFMMGSLDSDPDADPREKPQHKVQITKPFYLGATEVTQGQWQTLMGTSPWRGQSRLREGPDYAASYVSWDDATEFCRRLSAKDGREYRLPTEAEWEYNSCTAVWCRNQRRRRCGLVGRTCAWIARCVKFKTR